MKNLNNSIDNDILTMFNNKQYPLLALNNSIFYKSAKPYPHIYIDNFLPTKIAKKIANEYPKITRKRNEWKHHNNENVRRYFLDDTSFFSKNLKLFSLAIQSRNFLLFLEVLTGIKGLQADPYYLGGGAMTTPPEGFLKVHVDFNWHQKLQSWRRINVLFYLTESWREDWGGDLEIWNQSGDKKIHSISPLFNRMVVFSTTSKSYHGQPTPTNAPAGTFRNVFSAFYYTNNSTKDINANPHYTCYNDKIFKNAKKETSPYCEKIIQDYLKDISP